MARILLVSTMICVLVYLLTYLSTGGAYNDPRLGAAGVIADEFVPPAEGEEGEADHDEYYPHEHGVDEGALINKALECFDERHVSKCRSKCFIRTYTWIDRDCCLNAELYINRYIAVVMNSAGSLHTGRSTCPPIILTNIATGRVWKKLNSCSIASMKYWSTLSFITRLL